MRGVYFHWFLWYHVLPGIKLVPSASQYVHSPLGHLPSPCSLQFFSLNIFPVFLLLVRLFLLCLFCKPSLFSCAHLQALMSVETHGYLQGVSFACLHLSLCICATVSRVMLRTFGSAAKSLVISSPKYPLPAGQLHLDSSQASQCF